MTRRGNWYGNENTSLVLPERLCSALGDQDYIEIYEVKESAGWDVEGTVYDVYAGHRESSPTFLKGATKEELEEFLDAYFSEEE